MEGLLGQPNTENRSGESAPSTDKGKESSGSSSWRDNLSEPLRKATTLGKFKEVEDLAKSYVELEGKFGSRVSIPDKDTAPEELEKFYSKIGRPGKPDDYQLPPLEGVKLNDDYLKAMKSLFHQAGLTAKQAEAVWSGLSKNAQDSLSSVKKSSEEAQLRAQLEMEEAEKTLRKEWGLNFDLRLAQARRFVINTVGEVGIDYLEKKGVSSDPILLKLFAMAGSNIAPHRLVTGEAVEKPAQNGPYDYMNKR